MQLEIKTVVELPEEANLTSNAIYILNQRYLKRDDKRNVIETPQDMFRRVARTVASAELLYDTGTPVEIWEDRFYHLMANLEFLPNSPTLLNAGRPTGQLSACFVLPVGESLESNFQTLKEAVLVHKSGGGTGFSLSGLKPERNDDGYTGKVTGGPVSLIHALSAATDTVRQGGIRRGCNIAVLNVDHPEIIKFITAKNDPDVLTNFYISVAVTDDFIEAVKGNAPYSLLNPHTHEPVATLNAKEVFDRIVEQTWKTGDPGMVFRNRIEDDNPTPLLGSLEGVCGCGEQMLLPYESCNLGSINLARMVEDVDGTNRIDFPRLNSIVETAVRFLDNVIDVNRFPLPEIEEMTKKTRKIGLGVMGFADMLIQLGVPYDSEEGLVIAEEVMAFIDNKGHETSSKLAGERGVFPAFAGSKYDINGSPRLRNASCTTIAPTGTLSMIAGCSSGIEPNYALVFARNIYEGPKLLEVNANFAKTAKKEGFYSEDLMKMLAGGCRLGSFPNVPDEIKRIFVIAPEIEPEWHVRMQAAFQRHTDSAVSKTVNLPSDATREDVAKIYMTAWEERLKGITAYRNGSRALQPLFTGQAASDLVSTSLEGALQSVYATGTMEAD